MPCTIRGVDVRVLRCVRLECPSSLVGILETFFDGAFVASDAGGSLVVGVPVAVFDDGFPFRSQRASQFSQVNPAGPELS